MFMLNLLTKVSLTPFLTFTSLGTSLAASHRLLVLCGCKCWFYDYVFFALNSSELLSNNFLSVILMTSQDEWKQLMEQIKAVAVFNLKLLLELKWGVITAITYLDFYLCVIVYNYTSEIFWRVLLITAHDHFPYYMN